MDYYNYVITFLIIVVGYTVVKTIVKVVQKIIDQQKCLDDDDLKRVVTTEIRLQDNYDAAIAHLGICKKCQKRLDEISRK